MRFGLLIYCDFSLRKSKDCFQRLEVIIVCVPDLSFEENN